MRWSYIRLTKGLGIFPLLTFQQWSGHGTTLSGGFAEYVAFPHGKVFKIHNLSDVDATLIEPASCACHGLDKIRPRLGSSVLMFGAGPTGLVYDPFPPFSPSLATGN